jgi:alpha-tubulin suppressor-like RCC1 family protein
LLALLPTDSEIVSERSLLTKRAVLAPLKRATSISTKLLTIAFISFGGSFALSKDDKVYATGVNSFGRFDLGDRTNRDTFADN